MDIKKAIQLGTAKITEFTLEGDYRHRLAWFSFYKKPTRHRQHCYVCHKSIVKGERIAREICTCGGGGYAEYAYVHMDCFVAAVLLSVARALEKRTK